MVRSKVRLAATVTHLGEAAMLREVRALARLCVLYTGIRLATEEKSAEKTLSQDI